MSGSKYCVAAVVALINDCFVGPKNSRWKSSRQKELRNDHEKVISLLRLAGVDVSRRVPPPILSRVREMGAKLGAHGRLFEEAPKREVGGPSEPCS